MYKFRLLLLGALLFANVGEAGTECDSQVPVGCKLSTGEAATIAGGGPGVSNQYCQGGATEILVQFISGMCQKITTVNCHTGKILRDDTEWDCWSGW